MPTRHGGSCMNQDSTFERRSARRTTTVPCSSTACTWKTPFARSTPTVLIFFMDGSRVLVSAIQLWHIDAARGPSTHHCERHAKQPTSWVPDRGERGMGTCYLRLQPYSACIKIK